MSTTQLPYEKQYEHTCKFFIFEVKAAFEPTTIDSYNNELPPYFPTLYERVEYAILGCNCGAVSKKRVEKL